MSDWSSDVCSSYLSDEQTARAACATASSPDAHNLFTVVPGQETGIPASNADIRATLRLSSPAWFAQPRMTSSMDERSSAAFRPISARRGIAARSSARMCASAPLYRPLGVRTASQIKASTIDRKSVVQGKSVSVRVNHGGRRIIKKKQYTNTTIQNHIT